MRRSNFGKAGSSSSQRHSVLKPRNTDSTPTGRISGQLHKKLRTSTDGRTRLSQANSRFTPSRSNIPKYTPVDNNAPSTSGLSQPPSATRFSVDSTRSTSLGGKNRKDTRPIGEPGFKNECIDKIMEFLESNRCSYVVTRKTLQSPITRDFVNIFNFIYGHLDPNYTLPSKFEEEIPRILKAMNYPAQITKSTFTPIGSRHTWPTVLAMLAWLIDCISIMSPPLSDSLLAFNNSNGSFNENTVDLRMKKLYEMYVSQDVNLEEHLDDYEHQLMRDAEVRPQDLQKLVEENLKLDNEIAETERGPQRLHYLMSLYEEIISDRDKVKSYSMELNQYFTRKTNEKAQLQAQLDETKETLHQLNEEQAHLEKEKERQGLTIKQITEFKVQSKEVSDEIAQIKAKGNDLDLQIWTLQMNLAKVQKEIEDLGLVYNKNVRELKLGERFEIVLCNVSEVLNDWKKILWELKDNQKVVKQAMYESQREKMRKLDATEMVQDAVNDKKSDAEKLETKLRRLEEDINLTKEEIEKEENEMELEMEHLHQSILESRKEKLPLRQLENALEEAKNDLEATKSNGRARIRAGSEFLLKVCHEAINHLDKKIKLARHFRKNVMEYCNERQESIGNMIVFAQETLEKLNNDEK